MGLDFRALLRPTPRRARFAMDGWFVWGATLLRTDDGVCHLLFSRWPEEHGHRAWVTHSEIAHATATDPLGPYTYQSTVFPGAGDDAWDADVTHNPTAIRVGDRYYLYYMGTRGPGEWWDYRNRQRVGVAVAAHPGGPWQRCDRPVLDVTPGAWDHLMTSNPSCCQGPDGRFHLVYKGVGGEPLPRGAHVLCGVAVAQDPLGPFVKQPAPIIGRPEDGWVGEDPFIWCQEGRFYGLFKDYHGPLTGGLAGGTALFESGDGLHWELAANPLAVPLEIPWDHGGTETVGRLERPQIWLENGVPKVLLLACEPSPGARCFNVQVPLGES
jgi:hypothetical protein